MVLVVITHLGNFIFFTSTSFSNWKLEKKRKKKRTMDWQKLCHFNSTLWSTVRTFRFLMGIFLYYNYMFFFLPCSYRLFDSSEDPVEPSEEDKPEDASPQPTGQSYAATVALPSSPPASATLMGTLVLNIKWNLVEFRHMKGTKFLCKSFSNWLEKCSDCLHRSNTVI